MNTPLLSIVIPVYNREEKIRECLDSILSALQSVLDHIEIIIVDDASIDDSYNVCEGFAQKYDIITCIRLDDNQGPGFARNRGIDAARGKFLFFLDSDDLIVTDNLGEIIRLLNTHLNSDIFLLHATLEGTGNIRVRKHSAVPVQGYIPIENFISGIPAIPLVWQCIIKRDFLVIKRLRFFHTYYCEDIPFTASALFYADNLYLIPLSLCRHRLGNVDSLMVTAVSNRKRMFDGITHALNAFGDLYADTTHLGWYNTLLVQLYEMMFLLLGTLSPSELQYLLNKKDLVQKSNFSGLTYNTYRQLGIEKMVLVFFSSLLNKINTLTEGGQRAFFLCPACPRTIMLSEAISCTGIRINGFLDNNPLDDNRSVRWCRDNGYQVLSPKDVLTEKPIILISSNANVIRELLTQFDAIGLLEDIDFISPFPRLMPTDF